MPLTDWEHVIAAGRESGLLGRLYWTLWRAGELGAVPAAPAAHLHSAWLAAEAQRRAVIREVDYLVDVLASVAPRVVLLKGAAYALAGLPPACGRQFSDIDLLVPRAALDAVERRLNRAGWLGTHHGVYDQRYYREWMHELPPLRHPQRGSTLDVHHTILPETARFRPDADALVSASRSVPGHPGLAVLAPEDMVIHSATHLFVDGEIPNGLRDLLDLDALLRHFGGDAAFWEALPGRARELELGAPLWLALRYCQRMLGTPIPRGCGDGLVADAPSTAGLAMLDACYGRLLVPQVPEARGGIGRNSAAMAIFLRGHWLRMPLPLLARHAFRKGVVVPLFGDGASSRP
ncbi:nucleotidyltransferase family protein [Aquisalimonas sp.]|uniref:nucleotidyltransferase domain-containing protein n=1 Tax=unclassified Aquisalimonas TaxID=2644645 RepID=UPI0025C1F0CC|nr:nucleotidyltransferase family protein [Aquisalimonas sp.]